MTKTSQTMTTSNSRVCTIRTTPRKQWTIVVICDPPNELCSADELYIAAHAAVKLAKAFMEGYRVAMSSGPNV